MTCTDAWLLRFPSGCGLNVSSRSIKGPQTPLPVLTFPIHLMPRWRFKNKPGACLVYACNIITRHLEGKQCELLTIYKTQQEDTSLLNNARWTPTPTQMIIIKATIMRMTDNLKAPTTRHLHNQVRSWRGDGGWPTTLAALHKKRMKKKKNRQAQPNIEARYLISPLRTASGKVKILRQQSLSLHAGIRRAVCGAVWWCNSAVMRIGGEDQERTVIKGRNRKSPREIRVLFERQFMLRWSLIQGVAALGRDRMTF